jgi:hypothetical protein
VAILLYCLLVILGATTEIASRATLTIPTFALCFADCINAGRVNDLRLHSHIALLDSLHDHNRQIRAHPLISKSAFREMATHCARSKLLLAGMTEFNERTVFKLLQIPWSHEQLTAVSAFA